MLNGNTQERIRVIPINLVSSSRIRRRIEFSCLVGERELGVLGFGFLESVLVHYCISLFFIVKFLRRLRGGRQFAEPRKFLCSLCVLVI